MLNQFSRTELIIGKQGLNKLKKAKVAVFGIGGVGSFVVEGLVRAGIYSFIIIDNDKISMTNINRQIHATTKTIGEYKTKIMKQRILEINPLANVETIEEFYLPENSDKIFNNSWTYIVDGIDTVTSKVDLVVKANKFNIPIISCMGTGNKLDPSQLKVADIYDTSVCPLAKIMRKELRKNNIKKLKVVYSTELPIEPKCDLIEITNKIVIPGSISFVPSIAGLIIAGEVIKDIINK